ncbi:MAG: hypothetical protein M1824_004047 [Vezdaea acicularis]|nr:MAG: hypothetical protein M1824_004047 [Vezdaea acicularis]
MDSLSGFDWPSQPSHASNQTAHVKYPTLQPTPSPVSSGRASPLPNQSSTLGNPPKGSSGSKDSFSTLVAFGSAKSTNNLSLQERQKQLQEQKLAQESERRKQYESQFGAQNAQFWDTWEGSGSKNPAQTNSGLSKTITANTIRSAQEEEDDLLSAFSSEAPVNSSSYFPPPVSTRESNTPSGLRAITPPYPTAKSGEGSSPGKAFVGTFTQDDNDPFGLGSLPIKKVASNATKAPQEVATNNDDDDDDVLGLLGKPISDLPKPTTPKAILSSNINTQNAVLRPASSQDGPVAELVDMGFPEEKARRALAETDSGINVQAAVGILLNKAHEESRQKNKGQPQLNARSGESTDSTSGLDRSQKRGAGADAGDRLPAWMQGEVRSGSRPRRKETDSPADSEKDISQLASEVGSNLFKSANSLWNTSRKKVQKAVAEFQQEGGPSQPKWMRDAQLQAESGRAPADNEDYGSNSRSSKESRTAHTNRSESVTDEAMMLEMGGTRPPPRKAKMSGVETRSSTTSSRDQSPAFGPESAEPQRGKPAWMNERSASSQRDPRSKLSRQTIEEQSSQAYISPARRKKTSTPQPQDKARDEDLLPEQPSRPTSTPSLQSRNPFQPLTKPAPPPKPSKPSSASIPTRPKAPPRHIPPTSQHALQSSTTHRLRGTDAFKRGDYAAAHTAYTSALSPLPERHPLTIILLTNRSLTGLKTGSPKSAAADADAALTLIGPSRGEGESIDTGPGPSGGAKDMHAFYAKALTRKAEALEQLEKWAQAATVWRTAVQAGLGGPTAIQGRDRCEKAATAPPSSARHPAPARPLQKKKPLPPKRPLIDPTKSTEAVSRLRAANAAAERADDEKFALADAVDARLAAWRGGKADNLRALLGSLDKVLWEGAGWKKVGMADLVLPAKVKLVYMRGIGRVHPDKIPTNATTEQKMISAAVFSTLNEAWDKFKKENGL